MHDLLTAYAERRRRELHELAGIMYAAHHKPDQIEKFLPKPVTSSALDSTPTMNGGDGEPDFEEWWKTPDE
jgi:hypothetical protein